MNTPIPAQHIERRQPSPSTQSPKVRWGEDDDEDFGKGYD